MAAFLLCPRMASSLCEEGERAFSSMSLLFPGTPVLWDYGPVMTSFNLPEDSVSTYSHTGG